MTDPEPCGGRTRLLLVVFCTALIVLAIAAGARLAGAGVQLRLESKLAGRELLVGPHALNLDGAVRRASGEVTTDEHGYFELLGLPRGPHRAVALPVGAPGDR